MILLGVLAVGCSNPNAPTPVSAPVAPRVLVDGVPLSWLPAAACAPASPLPIVAGTEPQRTLTLQDGTLRAFWPTSEVQTVARNHTRQNFVIGDFIVDGGSWRVCEWNHAVREQFVCDIDYCP